MLMIMRAKQMTNKLCSECGEIKPVSEYNLTDAGRYKAYCKDCDYNLSQPKQRPKIVGKAKGKPILGGTFEYKPHKPFYEPEHKVKAKPKPKLPATERVCRECGETKPIKEVYRNICHDCREIIREQKRRDSMDTLYKAASKCVEKSNSIRFTMAQLSNFISWDSNRLSRVLNDLGDEDLLVKEKEGRTNIYYLVREGEDIKDVKKAIIDEKLKADAVKDEKLRAKLIWKRDKLIGVKEKVEQELLEVNKQLEEVAING